MRKVVAMICIIGCIFICACSSVPNGMSEQHYQYGLKVLEIIDQYLDYDISAEEAYQRITDTEKRSNELPNSDFGDDDNEGNFDIEFNVTMTSYAMMKVMHDPTQDNYKELLSQRNKLASCLGKKSR